MRARWWTLLAASIALGCIGPGAGQTGPFGSQASMPGGGARLAQNGGANWATPSGPPTSAPTSTWGRFVAAVTPGSSAPSGPAGLSPADIQRRQELDPISLSHPIGTPTPELYVAMATLSERSGNAEQARTLYNKAIERDPQRLEALLGLARLEDRAGRLDQALQLYHRAAAAHPNNPSVLNDLGLCYARAGELPRSLAILDRPTRLAPDNQLYRNNIAKVLVEMNYVNDALAHQVAVHPPAVAHYNVGVLLQQRNRSQEAVHFLSAAVAGDPSLAPARELLDELRAIQLSTAGGAQVNAPTSASSGRSTEVARRSASASTTPFSVSPPVATTSAPRASSAADPSVLPTPPDAGAIPSTQSAPMLLPPVE